MPQKTDLGFTQELAGETCIQMYKSEQVRQIFKCTRVSRCKNVKIFDAIIVLFQAYPLD